VDGEFRGDRKRGRERSVFVSYPEFINTVSVAAGKEISEFVSYPEVLDTSVREREREKFM